MGRGPRAAGAVAAESSYAPRRGSGRVGEMETLRLYLKYAGVSIRSQMQYRASFIMAALGHLIVTGFEFLAIAVLFQRFASLQGWRLQEVAVLYGMTHVAFALAEAFARGFDTFPRMIRGGDFDRLLLRPQSTAFQVAAGEIQIMRVGRFTQGLA
ncbi:MAG: hypothetical protein GF320_22870, partial [Armatimonadia bacterium]|nr:hypothetical protein [Armatimonadia bacterium]